MEKCQRVLRGRTFLIIIWMATTGFISGRSEAVSFLSFDARSLSMGGTGVVTARAHNASLFNPALLLNHDSGRRSRFHLHTYAGARLLDRDNFIDTAEAFSEKYEDADLKDLFTDRISIDERDYASADELRSATSELRVIQSDINTLSDKPLRAAGSYGLSFGYPSGEWALGGYSRRFLVLGSVVRIAPEDNDSINRVTGMVDRFADLFEQVASAEQLAEQNESLTLAETVASAERLWQAAVALNEYIDFDAFYDDAVEDQLDGKRIEDYLREPLPSEFHSYIETRGAEVTEQALSFGRTLGASDDGRWHLGLTLKQLHFTAIHFRQKINEFELEAYRDATHRRSTQRFNMDLGLVRDLPGRWQWGLVVRNLISHEVETVLGEPIQLDPVARVGLGYRADDFRVSADFDLTANEPLGFDPDKQYTSIGLEWFVWRNTALRMGLRHNAIDGETLPSIGVGLGGHLGHLDIGVARSPSEDEWGLALQAGLAF